MVAAGNRLLLLAAAMMLLVTLVPTSSADAAKRRGKATAMAKHKKGRALLPAWGTRSSSGRKPRPAGSTTSTPGSRAPGAPIRFGIYPGGGAGAVGPRGEPIPEDPVKRLAALKQLRGDAPFVLHLYEEYHDASDAQAIPSWLRDQVREADDEGFQVEMVLRYRPRASSGDVAGFASFVRRRVRQYGTYPGVTALQITNEANIVVAPDAADGWYPGARRALVEGVVAADDEARKAGLGNLAIGFNWANGVPALERPFFSDLRRIGGSRFAAAVDWVGVDAYPGTWGPPLGVGGLASTVRTATIDTMRAMRTSLLPAAGLGDAAIRFAESGYPTDAIRTEERQVTVMTAAVETVHEFRDTYGVTDYRWFDLRDADSAHPSFESHYGITRHDYSPKPAFGRYRDLVGRLG